MSSIAIVRSKGQQLVCHGWADFSDATKHFRQEIKCDFINYFITQMIGSLEEFLDIEANAEETIDEPKMVQQSLKIPSLYNKKRGKTTMESYTAGDKTQLLALYQKNNIFKNNRKKYHSIMNDIKKKQPKKKPLYQHKSFFTKPEITRDYIAKQELQRKHNLLRAIIRLNQLEQEPKGQSEYQQSFNRLFDGFKAIQPTPVLNSIRNVEDKQQVIKYQKSIIMSKDKRKGSVSNRTRVQFQNCLNWAKKHKKNGQFYATKLGKQGYQAIRKRNQNSKSIMNRSYIQQIQKRMSIGSAEE